MAEQPHLIPDILERLPTLHQAGLDHSARMAGVAVQSFLHWLGFNPERLAQEDLSLWLQEQYDLLGEYEMTALSLLAKLSELFTPRLEDLRDGDESAGEAPTA